VEKPPVQVDIQGKKVVCEYGQVEAHIYRLETDSVFNHVEIVEHGTQRLYVFNMPSLIMFLSGIEVPNHGLGKKEVRTLTEELEREAGWNCELRLMDEAPEEVKERYVKLAAKVLKAEIVYVPETW